MRWDGYLPGLCVRGAAAGLGVVAEVDYVDNVFYR